MLYALDLHELVDENDEPYSYFQFDPVSPELLEWPWLNGECFDAPPPEPLALKFDPDDEDAGGLPDYQAGPIPLVSARLRRVLEKSGVANIDYFATRIDGGEVFADFPQYYAVNVIGKVSALSGNSAMTPTFGTTRMAATIDRLDLPDGLARGEKLFRLAEHVITVFVDDAVRRACLAADIDTLRFIPADKWTS
jgi:hypothetical protein